MCLLGLSEGVFLVHYTRSWSDRPNSIKYEYLTGEQILLSDQKQIIEQAKFTYSPLGKAFGKQTKTIKEQGEKQIKATESNKGVDNESHKIFDEVSYKRMSEIEDLSR